MHFKVGVCALACLGLLGACSKSANNGASGSGGSGAAGQVSGTGGNAGSSAMGTGGSGAAGKAPGTGGGSGTAGSSSSTGGSSAAGNGAGGSGASGSGAGGSGASGSGASGSGASGGAGGKGTGTGGSAGTGGGAFSAESMAFKDGSKIDAKYRCMGPSPDLAWSGAPSGAMSYAAVLEDVTPGISQGFLHWVIYDIPGSAKGLPENVMIAYAPSAPAGAHQAPNYSGTQGFNGPCGFSGTNTYELTVYALDVATLPGLSMSSTGADTVTAIQAHKLASAKLTVMSSP